MLIHEVRVFLTNTSQMFYIELTAGSNKISILDNMEKMDIKKIIPLSYQAMFSLVNPYIYGNQRGESIQSSVTQFRVRNCDVTDSKRRRRRREADAAVANTTDDANGTDVMKTQVGVVFHPTPSNAYRIYIYIYIYIYVRTYVRTCVWCVCVCVPSYVVFVFVVILISDSRSDTVSYVILWPVRPRYNVTSLW